MEKKQFLTYDEQITFLEEKKGLSVNLWSHCRIYPSANYKINRFMTENSCCFVGNQKIYKNYKNGHT